MPTMQSVIRRQPNRQHLQTACLTRPLNPHCLLPAAADLPGLPAEVNRMLEAGGWSAAAVRWTVAVAARLQAAVDAGRLEALHEAALHDATSALLLVRAATAALALVSDVGFEAAVRHLSQEFSRVAAKARPLTAGRGGVRYVSKEEHCTGVCLLLYTQSYPRWVGRWVEQDASM